MQSLAVQSANLVISLQPRWVHNEAYTKSYLLIFLQILAAQNDLDEQQKGTTSFASVLPVDISADCRSIKRWPTWTSTWTPEGRNVMHLNVTCWYFCRPANIYMNTRRAQCHAPQCYPLIFLQTLAPQNDDLYEHLHEHQKDTMPCTSMLPVDTLAVQNDDLHEHLHEHQKDTMFRTPVLPVNISSDSRTSKRRPTWTPHIESCGSKCYPQDTPPLAHSPSCQRQVWSRTQTKLSPGARPEKDHGRKTKTRGGKSEWRW